VNAYLTALQEFQATGTGTARAAMERAIIDVLAWLWDAIAEPVLDAAGHRHPPGDGQPWPRLWWCPTGPLTVVPLHAAGHHDDPGDRSVLDRVVSSYTPTLRALSSARTRPPAGPAGGLLLIALPETPGASPLPAVAAEQAFLTGLLTGTRCTVLAGADATRANILRELDTHTWTHAACHGDQNMADPSTGGLVPYDWNTAGLVNVLDLTSADQAGGEFAFLSACKTATGGVAVLDEAISLTAALHYAGWRHVIGTLWTVWDDAAAEIAQDTYVRLARDGRLDPARAAEALHHAVRGYRHRADHRRQPSRWAPFLHTGP
jgi:CHAT domain-containing protein